MKSKVPYELRISDGTTTVLNPRKIILDSIQVDGKNVTASLGGASVTDIPSTALRLLASGGHISHGYFWEASKPYYEFFWDALVRPFDTNETGYLISAGYGGAHALLWGFNSNSTHFSITGNIWDNNGNQTITFSTATKFPLGAWHHVAVGWNKQTIVVWVNGVAEGSTAFAADSRITPGVETPVMYVGGSNHSKFDMDVAWIRGFEGRVPFYMGLMKPFRTHRWPLAHFGSDGTASFLADYTRPCSVIPDLSSGLTNGTSQAISQTVSVTTVTSGNAKCVVTANGMPSSPKTVTFAVAANDSASQVAGKARTALSGDSSVGPFFHVGGTNTEITLTVRTPQAFDSTMNVTIEDDTSGGINDDTSSTVTVSGYAGQMIRHPGVREGLVGQTGAFIDSNNTIEAEDGFPTWVAATIAKPSITADSAPTGSPLLYDTFSRLSVPFWDNDSDISLGSTEGGSVGIKSWGGATTNYGCQANQAYYYGEGYGNPVYVDTTATDIETRFDFTVGLTAYVRYTDANNYIAIQQIGTALSVSKLVAGVGTSLYNNAVEGSASGDVRVVTVGNNIKVYYGGVQKCNVDSALPTGTNVGFLLTSYGLERMNGVTVYAAS